MARKDHAMSSLTDPVGPVLAATLRALELGRLTAHPARTPSPWPASASMPDAASCGSSCRKREQPAAKAAPSPCAPGENSLDPAMRTEASDPRPPPSAAARGSRTADSSPCGASRPPGALIVGARRASRRRPSPPRFATSPSAAPAQSPWPAQTSFFKRLTTARLDDALDYRDSAP